MSVRVTACRSFALSGRLCACPAAWGKGGGGSVGRRGGTEALGRTAPPWLPVGLGTGQVSGRMGAQGPGWAAPRPTGGSEARGPRGSGWRRVRKPDTSGPHGPEQRTGSGEARFAERSRAWRGPGWEGTETSAPLSPPPRPRTHARTHARHAAGGPGSPPGCRTWPGVCWPRGGGVRGAWRHWLAGVWSRVLRLKYSARPRGEVRPAGPTGRSERKGGAAQGS